MICENGTLHYLKNSFILKGISQGRKCLLDMIPIYYFLSTPSVPCPLVIHQSPWKGILWWQIYHWSRTVLSWLFSLVWHLCIGFNYCLDHSLWLVFNYLQLKKRYTIWVYAWGILTGCISLLMENLKCPFILQFQWQTHLIKRCLRSHPVQLSIHVSTTKMGCVLNFSVGEQSQKTPQGK